MKKRGVNSSKNSHYTSQSNSSIWMKVGLTVMKVILTVGANQVNASTLNDQVMGKKD